MRIADAELLRHTIMGEDVEDTTHLCRTFKVSRQSWGVLSAVEITPKELHNGKDFLGSFGKRLLDLRDS